MHDRPDYERSFAPEEMVNASELKLPILQFGLVSKPAGLWQYGREQ